MSTIDKRAARKAKPARKAVAALAALQPAPKAEGAGRDRWGNTPLDDARRHGRADVAALLERCAASQTG